MDAHSAMWAMFWGAYAFGGIGWTMLVGFARPRAGAFRFVAWLGLTAIWPIWAAVAIALLILEGRSRAQ